MSFSQAPSVFMEAAWRMASTLSFFAASMKPQVFTTSTWASSSTGVIW